MPFDGGFSTYPINPYKQSGPNFGLLDVARGSDSSRTQIVQAPNLALENERGLLAGLSSLNEGLRTGAEIQNQKAEMALKQQALEEQKAMMPLNIAEKEASINEHTAGAANNWALASLHKTEAQSAQDKYNDITQASKNSGGSMDKFIAALKPQDRGQFLAQDAAYRKDMLAGQESMTKMTGEQIDNMRKRSGGMAAIGMGWLKFDPNSQQQERNAYLTQQYDGLKDLNPSLPPLQYLLTHPDYVRNQFISAISWDKDQQMAIAKSPYLQAITTPTNDRQTAIDQIKQLNAKTPDQVSLAGDLTNAQANLRQLQGLIDASGGLNMASPELKEQYLKQQDLVKNLSAQNYKGTTPVIQNLQAASTASSDTIRGNITPKDILMSAAASESTTPAQKQLIVSGLKTIQANEAVDTGLNQLMGDTVNIKHLLSSAPNLTGPGGVGAAQAWLSSRGQELTNSLNQLILDSASAYSGSKSFFRNAIGVQVLMNSKANKSEYIDAAGYTTETFANKAIAAKIDAWTSSNEFYSSQVSNGQLTPKQYQDWLLNHPNPAITFVGKYDVEGVNQSLPSNRQISAETAKKIGAVMKNPYDTPATRAAIDEGNKLVEKIISSAPSGQVPVINKQGQYFYAPASQRDQFKNEGLVEIK